LIVLAYCDKNEATGKVTTCTHYFSAHTQTRADASGILHCIGDGIKASWCGLDSECVLDVKNFPVLCVVQMEQLSMWQEVVGLKVN